MEQIFVTYLKNNIILSIKSSFGEIVIEKLPEFSLQNIFYFRKFYIDKNFRKKGLSNVLMTELIKYLDQHKINLICDVSPYDGSTYQQLYKIYNKYNFKERDEFFLANSIIDDDKNCLIRYFQ